MVRTSNACSPSVGAGVIALFTVVALLSPPAARIARGSITFVSGTYNVNCNAHADSDSGSDGSSGPMSSGTESHSAYTVAISSVYGFNIEASSSVSTALSANSFTFNANTLAQATNPSNLYGSSANGKVDVMLALSSVTQMRSTFTGPTGMYGWGTAKLIAPGNQVLFDNPGFGFGFGPAPSTQTWTLSPGTYEFVGNIHSQIEASTGGTGAWSWSFTALPEPSGAAAAFMMSLLTVRRRR